MFCALNGATRSPDRAKIRQSAAVSRLLPTPDEVPRSIRQAARLNGRPPSSRAGVAPTQVLPECRALPAWRADPLGVVIEPRIGEVHGDHLPFATLPGAEAPPRGGPWPPSAACGPARRRHRATDWGSTR